MLEEEIMQIISENLKYEMEDKQYSRKSLAFDSGITEASLSRYLNCERLISIVNLVKLCDTLDCNLDDILPLDALTLL